MSQLIDHAKRELLSAGLFDEDSDYAGGLGDSTIALIKLFSEQGHSGFSAATIRSLFAKLADFLPLGPLTGGDEEWTEVSEGLFQNKRCSRVFKDSEGAFDVDGIVFTDNDGVSFTGRGSKVSVVFPYVPKTVYKKAEPEKELTR